MSGVIVMVLSLALAGAAAGSDPARMLAEKGCVRCHRIGGLGEGGTASDLAHLKSGAGVFDVGAAMWNHLPQMRAGVPGGLAEWPQFTPRQLSDLMAFLFAAQPRRPTGHAAAGARLYVSRGCAGCHGSGKPGRGDQAAVDVPASALSPVLLVAEMWNHGFQIGQATNRPGVARAPLTGGELAHILAYLETFGGRARDGGVPAVAGAVERGRQLFAETGCASCHRAPGQRSEMRWPPRPDSGRRTLIGMAASMWRHGAAVRAEATGRGGAPVRLTAQDGADLVAFLHASHYFDVVEGDGRKGRQLVRDRGCLTCHALDGEGGDSAPDLARANVVGSQAGQLAALWNHGRYMNTQAQRRGVELSPLTAQELADVTRFLAGLGSLVPTRR